MKEFNKLSKRELGEREKQIFMEEKQSGTCVNFIIQLKDTN